MAQKYTCKFIFYFLLIMIFPALSLPAQVLKNGSEKHKNIPISFSNNRSFSIKGVQVYLTVNEINLSKKYCKRTERGIFKAIDLSEYKKEEVFNNLVKALNKYPDEIITSNLKKIYILNKIIDRNASVGGLSNKEGSIFIMYKDTGDLINQEKFIQALHHEFAHILHFNYYKSIKHSKWLKKWKSCNTIGYGKSGNQAIKMGKANTEFDDSLHEKGFLYEYATANVQEDFASFAENLFTNKRQFWEVCEKYPLLARKLSLMIEFYNTIYKGFDLEFFMQYQEK